MSRPKYELVFSGSADARNFPKRYKRYHSSLESARATVLEMREKIDALRHHNTQMDGPHRYNAIVYGPGLGDAGRVIPWEDAR